MNNTLKEIIQHKGKEITDNKNNQYPQEKYHSHGNIFQEIFQEKTASIIGEVKLASPSYDYSDKIDYQEVIDNYVSDTNIKAISILIDEKFFQGDINRIKYAKNNGKKPILFKEFILSKSQIDQAGDYGYDALLLMKKILSLSKLEDFILYSQGKNIFPIVEVDSGEDLESILKIPNKEFGIGINARNFDTMKVDTKIHFEIYKKYKQQLKERITFAFSGIKSYENKDIKEYKGIYNGILIGTNLIKNMIQK